MKVHQMQCFESVCRLNSVSKAAMELHVAQPSVSNAISELERELGFLLFHRMKKRLVLTDEGNQFLDRIKPILTLYCELEIDVKKLSKKQNYIRFGIPPMIGTFLFSKMYKEYHALDPIMRIRVEESGTIDTIKKVREGNLDIALVILNELDQTYFETIELLETKLLFCVHKDHPFSLKEVINIEDILMEPIISFKEDTFQSLLIRKIFDIHEVTGNIILSTSQVMTMIALVKEGVASAFMFKELLRQEDQIVGIEVNELPTIKIGLIWLKNGKLPLEAQRFVKFSKKYAKGL